MLADTESVTTSFFDDLVQLELERFNCDIVSIANATMTTLNGTSYAACTTTQYNNYKPSSNSTAITVLPQTTTGATTPCNLTQHTFHAKK
jgi:hypothetical protein